MIFAQPQQERAFNGSIDIATNLPLVCYPIFDHSVLSEKKVLGVVEIPQPQLRCSGVVKSKLKEMIIDEVMKDSLDTLSKIISQVLTSGKVL